jgi:GntR family transcriptional regulator
MRQRGLRPGTRLVGAELTPATAVIAQKLQIEEGTTLARIERLRLADGEPMSVEVSFLVHQYCPGILGEDYTAHSLRRMLEEQYDIRIASARQTIRAISASQEMAQLLDAPPQAALLYIERISYAENDVPVEFLRLYHRGDRYTLHGELRG